MASSGCFFNLRRAGRHGRAIRILAPHYRQLIARRSHFNQQAALDQAAGGNPGVAEAKSSGDQPGAVCAYRDGQIGMAIAIAASGLVCACVQSHPHDLSRHSI